MQADSTPNKTNLRASIIQSLREEDPISSILTMLSLKVLDLCMRIESFSLDQSDRARDHQWKQNFLKVSKKLAASKQSSYVKTIMPLVNFIKKGKN